MLGRAVGKVLGATMIWLTTIDEEHRQQLEVSYSQCNLNQGIEISGKLFNPPIKIFVTFCC